jgi:hypothetical protein
MAIYGSYLFPLLFLAFGNAKAIPNAKMPLAQYFRGLEQNGEGDGAGKDFPPCPGRG